MILGTDVFSALNGFSNPHRAIVESRVLLAIPNISTPVIHLGLAPLICPLEPTPRVVSHGFIPRVSCQLRRGAAPHARLAEKDQLGRVGALSGGFLEAKEVVKLLGGQVESVRVGYYWDVEGRRDRAG